MIAWVKDVRQEGFYVSFVTGGPKAWDSATDTANAKSREINYRPVINVGNGCDGYTAAEMAIFVAARVAAVALNSSLTDETVPYQAVNVRLKKSVRERAKKAGTIIFVAKGDTVEIDEGVNTLTSPKSGEVKEMGSIRVSSTIDYVVHDLELFGEEYKKAKSNTDSFRATYATTVQQQYLDPLVAQEILKEGASYEPDPDYYGENATKKAKANEAFFVGDITPNESPEKIYQKLSTALEKGVGNWYVASVKIPAREYDYQPTGETDDEGYDILEEVALDVNMRDVTLCLWGIPDMTQTQKESEVK